MEAGRRGRISGPVKSLTHSRADSVSVVFALVPFASYVLEGTTQKTKMDSCTPYAPCRRREHGAWIITVS